MCEAMKKSKSVMQQEFETAELQSSALPSASQNLELHLKLHGKPASYASTLTKNSSRNHAFSYSCSLQRNHYPR